MRINHLCLLLGLSALLLPVRNLTAQGIPKIRIDPSQAYGGTVSEYVGHLEYIPLETTKESLFGDVERLIITDSSFIIVDRDTRSVLFFSRTGKFLAKQSCGGDALPRVAIYREKRIVNVFCVNNSGPVKNAKDDHVENWTFTYTGVRVTGNKAYEGVNFKTAMMMPLGQDYFLSFRSCTLFTHDKNKDTLVSLVDVYKRDTLYKTLVSCKPKEELAFCTLGGSLVPGNVVDNQALFAAKQLSHVVYRLNKDTAQKVFQVVLPASRSLPPDVFTYASTRKLDSLQKLNFQNPQIVSHISHIHFVGNRLFLKLNSYYYPSTESADALYQYNLIYDTVTQRLVSLERMSPDDTSHYLPISGRRVVRYGLDYYNGYFFTALSSQQLFDAKASTKDKKAQYPPVLQQYFKTQNRKSNPVIVMMSFKE